MSTNVGGIPKIVHDGENGICCQVGDIDRLSKGIIDMLLSNEHRHYAAIASYKCVYKEYSLQKHLSLLETIYKNTEERVGQ